jgi:K+ transporter
MTNAPFNGFHSDAENKIVAESEETHHNESIKALVLGALGIVYGDIGTSLDYARDKESPDRNHGESTIYGQSNKR